jgi:hypothetical protein
MDDAVGPPQDQDLTANVVVDHQCHDLAIARGDREVEDLRVELSRTLEVRHVREDHLKGQVHRVSDRVGVSTASRWLSATRWHLRRAPKATRRPRTSDR